MPFLTVPEIQVTQLVTRNTISTTKVIVPLEPIEAGGDGWANSPQHRVGSVHGLSFLNRARPGATCTGKMSCDLGHDSKCANKVCWVHVGITEPDCSNGIDSRW